MQWLQIKEVLELTTSRDPSLQNWIDHLKEFQLDSIFETNILGRAYLLMNDVSIVLKEKNEVQASFPSKNYLIKINQSENKVQGSCSCPFDGKCKHMAATLLALMAHRLDIR